jgi:hypothetical protein
VLKAYTLANISSRIWRDAYSLRYCTNDPLLITWTEQSNVFYMKSRLRAYAGYQSITFCVYMIDWLGFNVTFRSISALSWLDSCAWLYTWSSTVNTVYFKTLYPFKLSYLNKRLSLPFYVTPFKLLLFM